MFRVFSVFFLLSQMSPVHSQTLELFWSYRPQIPRHGVQPVVPIAVGGQLVFAGPEPGSLVVAELETGLRIWLHPWHIGEPNVTVGSSSERKNEASTRHRFASNGTSLFALVGKRENTLTAFDMPREGKPLWSVGGGSRASDSELTNAKILSAPCVTRTDLYLPLVREKQIELARLDSTNGKLKGSVTLCAELKPPAALPSPVFKGDSIFCCSPDGVLHVTNLSLSGRAQFESRHHRNRRFSQELYAANLEEQPIVVWKRDDVLYCIDSELTRVKWTKSVPDSHVVAIDSGKVFLQSNDTLRALDLANGQEVWKRSFDVDVSHGSGIVIGRWLLVPTGTREVMCVSVSSGADAHRLELADHTTASLHQFSDMMVVVSDDGTVLVYRGVRRQLERLFSDN